MKVAVTAKGPQLTSPVDPRFERARYLVIFDTEPGEFTAHDMTACCAPAFDALITGNISRDAVHAFLAGSVTIYVGATRTVGEAIEQFKAGRLSCAIEPGVALSTV